MSITELQAKAGPDLIYDTRIVTQELILAGRVQIIDPLIANASGQSE
jgi:hypothetical protein